MTCKIERLGPGIQYLWGHIGIMIGIQRLFLVKLPWACGDSLLQAIYLKICNATTGSKDLSISKCTKYHSFDYLMRPNLYEVAD
jgi:hypothetical protein